MSSRQIRVISVDDHQMLIEGLRALIDHEPDMELTSTLTTTDGVIAEVRRVKADVILLDIDLPGGDPFEAVADLKAQCPFVRVIMFSAYVRDHYIDQAYEAGAWGYISKGDDPGEVIEGIRRVMRGEIAMSSSVEERSQPIHRKRGEKPEHGGSRLALLTNRELQVLRMIAKGMGRLDIAEALSRSPMTIDNHRKSIMKKLDINDRAELVRYAIAEGLVEV